VLLGAMNDPRRPVLQEVRAIAAAGFAFVDLTLEPPGADPAALPLAELGRTLRACQLELVGHTAWFLPLASPFPEVAAAAQGVVQRCVEACAALGARLVTVHPDPLPGLRGGAETVAANAAAVQLLSRHAASVGVRLMVENLPGRFGEPEALQPLLEAAPGAGFHLDVGHANLQPRPLAEEGGPAGRTAALLAAFGGRLCHVHLSDNLCGPDDLHLPIGAGRIAWAAELARLRAVYDGTLTLEVHAAEPVYLRESAAVVRRLWETAP